MIRACQKIAAFAAQSIGGENLGKGLGGRLARGAFWNAIAYVLPRAATMLGFIFIARILGKEAFGAIGVIQNTLISLGTFVGFGFGITATKYIAEYRTVDPQRAGRIIGMSLTVAGAIGLLFALVLFVFAEPIAVNWLASAALITPLKISAPMLFIYAINGVQLGTLSGLEAFKETASISIFGSLVSLSCIGGAYWGVNGVVCFLVIAGLLNCLVTAWLVNAVVRKHQIAIVYWGILSEYRILFSYSVPAVLANSLYAPVFWCCMSMLVNTAGGYAEMGEFNAANQWRSVAILLPTVLGQTSIPIVANSIASGRTDAAIEMLWKLFQGLLYIGLPLTLVLVLASPMIMSFYGSSFSSGWLVFSILQVAVLLQILQSPVIKYIEASGRLWLNLLFNAGQGAVMFLSAIYLVKFGAKGLALAVLLSFAAQSIFLVAFGLKIKRRLLTT